MLSRFIQSNVKCGTSLFTLLAFHSAGGHMHGSFSNAEGGLTKNFWSGVLGKVINLDFFRAWEKIFPMQDMNKVSQWEKKKGIWGKRQENLFSIWLC